MSGKGIEPSSEVVHVPPQKLAFSQNSDLGLS